MSNASTTREQRRAQFEQAVKELWNSNPSAGKYDLSPLIMNGVFNRYMDPDTDNAWIGFQLARVYDARVRSGLITATDAAAIK